VPGTEKGFGKLIATHRTAPAFIQRAAIIAILSFVFFLVMLVAFLVRQQIGYLILAAAFLVLNIFTLIGFVLQRQNSVSIFDNGLRYRKTSAKWLDTMALPSPPSPAAEADAMAVTNAFSASAEPASHRAMARSNWVRHSGAGSASRLPKRPSASKKSIVPPLEMS
jgi:hypothetical protein